MSRPALFGACVLLLFALFIAWGQGVVGWQSVEAAAESAANWWTLSDTDFVKQYGNLAVGTQQQQSKFAWMVFARANQQVPFGDKKQKFSQWELWASDLDTFAPNVPRFEAAKKIRPRPHLEPITQLQMLSRRARLTKAPSFPQDGGQEVTRNALSSDYIMGHNLNTSEGIATYLGKQGNRIEFPLGVVETKAYWATGSLASAHQEAGLSLTALHLMVKVQPTPTNPFTDNTPSWFWTTFELKSNAGLAAAQKFITYGDALPPAESKQLLTDAGLGDTEFTNYVCNGVQIQFGDAKQTKIVLGNTQLENGFATPAFLDPTTWTSWSSSCHSCHAQASGKISGNRMMVFGFTEPVGPLAGDDLPSGGYQAYDFVWALMKAP